MSEDLNAEGTVPFSLVRRTPEARKAYLEAKVPDVARRFNVSEDEARELLAMAGGVTAISEQGQVGPAPVTPATPATGSISFVLTRPDDETLKFGIEFAGQGGEEITTATHEEHGWDGMSLIEDTVKSIGEALGIEVVER